MGYRPPVVLSEVEGRCASGVARWASLRRVSSLRAEEETAPSRKMENIVYYNGHQAVMNRVKRHAWPPCLVVET